MTTSAKMAHFAASLLSASLLAGRALIRPLPPPTTVEQRLAAMPTGYLPLRKRVSIYWDDHQIPFIEAADDDDAAFALGLVHAHLRLGQMAVYRRIAQGRLAEMVGPVATDIDHGIRILDYGRAAGAIEASLPPATHRWLERFVEGINHYQARVRELPYEYAVLGLEPEPWTPRDILTFGRLAATDVTWLVWFNLLKLRERADWPRLWARLVENGNDTTPSLETAGGSTAFASLLAGVTRSGSNSIAVSGWRSRSGAAMIASDPHLGINLPNTWLIVGVKSPSYHVVGLMTPGLPVFAIGRNLTIAWGGTNMRAASSDLVDLAGLTDAQISVRKETIRVRGWFDRTVTLRNCRWGPILSDAPQLADFKLSPIALRWAGHQPSDEVTAFLRASRAETFAEFRQAFDGFAVPGQNMLFADRDGNIGQVMAVRVPDRGGPLPHDLIVPAAEIERMWKDLRGTGDLPFSLNPTKGYLASANNRPTDGGPAVGYFFSAEDRAQRMAALVERAGTLSVAELAALQQDVYVASSVALRDLLVRKIGSLAVQTNADSPARRALALIRDWDGNYRSDSQGAVAFELFRFAFTASFATTVLDETDWAAFANVAKVQSLLYEDIDTSAPKALVGRLQESLAFAGQAITNFPTWGDMHRLGLQHPFHAIPLIGGRFCFADYPIGGSSESLMKTAHGNTDRRHVTRYGANARHISDLADLDANYFVLLGGQDGWLNSTTFLDQVPVWLAGSYVRVPLRMETVRNRFRHRQDLGSYATCEVNFDHG